MNIKVSAAACLAAICIAFTSTASAAIYNYAGTLELCPQFAIPCATGSISVGDTLSGYFDIDDAAALANTSFDYEDVLGYDLTIGAFNVTSDNSSLVMGEVITDAGAELVDGFFHIYADALPNAPQIVATLDLTTGTWFVLAWTPQQEWPFLVATGTGGFTRVVPIPGAMWLFASALGLIAFRRR